jgi:hypothetical protein
MKKRFEHSLKREDQVKAGAYDGRYQVKVIPNKKKKLSREGARGPFSKNIKPSSERMVF